ncbi:MAG: hypothetical protein ACXAC6_18085 [Candidatus Hodarchaeales archaeon]|jgi:hypothetical protein
MGYRSLSLIQVVFITLAAISVLDFGYTQQVDPLGINNSDGLFFNKIMFDEDGLIGPILKDIDFWGAIQFWAYCFFVVAACQLGKALGSKK